MTITELIEQLTEMQLEHGADAEVRLMTQQNWPFENAIEGITSTRDIKEIDQDEDDEMLTDDSQATIYIVEGRQLCYGNKAAWEACL